MRRVMTDKNAYYQERYENNGYIITTLPYAFLIWDRDHSNRDYPIMTVNSLDEARLLTD